jgi:ribosomal protein S18 acetylase RimI-like enzyme
MVQVCEIIHEDDVEMGERDEEIGIINWGPQQDKDRDSSPSSNDSNWSIRFRPIEPQDRLRIQELHEAWFPVKYQDEFYEQLMLHRMPNTGEPLYTCVATDANDPDDTVVACVVGAVVDAQKLNIASRRLLLSDQERYRRLFYIMTLGTSSEYREAGLGTAMMQKCIEEVAQDPMCGALYLHVITLNHSAIRFYERLGFWRVQEIPDYYTIDGENYNCYLYAKYFHGECCAVLNESIHTTSRANRNFSDTHILLPTVSWSCLKVIGDTWTCSRLCPAGLRLFGSVSKNPCPS